MQKLAVQNKEQIRNSIHAYLQSNQEARYIHRLHALLLLIDSQHNNCTNIGKLFNNSPRSLANWVHKVNQAGDIEVLRDKQKPGRKSRLTAQQIEKVSQATQHSPIKAGINAKKWNGEVLSNYVKREFGIVLKVRQCQRLFKNLGLPKVSS